MSGAFLWIAFAAGIISLLALDLGVFNKKAHHPSLKEAAAWSAAWVTLALLFGAGVWWLKGERSGLEYLTGYLIELSLSVDNVFLFAVIFTAYGVPLRFQHRVLFWGILSAVVMRAIMIFTGAALLQRFHWLIYPFGALLLITGLKMLFKSHQAEVMKHNPLIAWLEKRIPLINRFQNDQFFMRFEGKTYATRLFLVLVLVEATDLMFALDSIPAVLAITRDPFIVFTSNILAILGLRSLYFLLSGVMDKFHYLTYGLAAILILVGFKMVGVVKIPITQSLLAIAAILAIAVTASLLRSRRLEAESRRPRAPKHLTYRPTKAMTKGDGP
jgi:tellurite resistance protein TerC